ncbi:MAG: pyridoxal kinase PdxY [Propionibacteriales bacterium]|nr:pyridoxal kinase PdxY [Propionibacteriales bacterium]
MRILSIQSAVAYGHVGNSAAAFPLQRLGHEVLAVNTVQFSNHTGYGAWRGPVFAGSDVQDVIIGIEERGALAEVDLVLSGYQGSPEIAAVILDAVARVKRANPAATYACDPVMGNARSGCFVDPAIPPLIREQIVPAADLLTPNQFELGELVGADLSDGERPVTDVLDAVERLRDRGPRTVLVTSVDHHQVPADQIAMIAVTDAGTWQVRTPRLPMKANGSGDVTAALFASHLGSSADPSGALARTASSVFDLLDATLTAGSRELLLVESQQAFAHPAEQFAVEQLR